MERAKRIESDLMAFQITEARDELNLAEFPLCALAHRLRPDQRTLHFQDRRGTRAAERQLHGNSPSPVRMPTAFPQLSMTKCSWA